MSSSHYVEREKHVHVTHFTCGIGSIQRSLLTIRRSTKRLWMLRYVFKFRVAASTSHTKVSGSRILSAACRSCVFQSYQEVGGAPSLFQYMVKVIDLGFVG